MGGAYFGMAAVPAWRNSRSGTGDSRNRGASQNSIRRTTPMPSGLPPVVPPGTSHSRQSRHNRIGVPVSRRLDRPRTESTVRGTAGGGSKLSPFSIREDLERNNTLRMAAWEAQRAEFFLTLSKFKEADEHLHRSG